MLKGALQMIVFSQAKFQAFLLLKENITDTWHCGLDEAVTG